MTIKPAASPESVSSSECAGGNSTALFCTGTFCSLNPTWTSNLSNFYSDLYARGLRDITPTPVFFGWGDDNRDASGQVFPIQTAVHAAPCSNEQTDYYYYQTSPFGVTVAGGPPCRRKLRVGMERCGRESILHRLG